MINPRKILYISPNAHLGGAERAIEIYLKYHHRDKYIPVVLFLRDGPLIEQFKKLGVKTYLVPQVRIREFWKYPLLIYRIIKIIRAEKINLIHSAMGYGHFFGGQAAFWSKTPCVWYQHGPVSSFDRLVSLIPTKVILVNSNYTKNEQKKVNLWPRLIQIVLPPIERNQLDQSKREILSSKFRKQFGIAKDQVLLGSVARIQEWKGQLYFLKAFHRALQKQDNLRAIIIGSADLGSKDYENQLKDFILKNKLQDKVLLTGFFEQLEEAYSAMDIFVHTSTLPEPFGLVITEAMMNKVAVIAAPFGGPLEIIENNVNGLLSNPKDTEDLALSILKIAGNERLRHELIDRAFQGLDKYLAPNVIAKLESIYDSI